MLRVWPERLGDAQTAKGKDSGLFSQRRRGPAMRRREAPVHWPRTRRGCVSRASWPTEDGFAIRRSPDPARQPDAHEAGDDCRPAIFRAPGFMLRITRQGGSAVRSGRRCRPHFERMQILADPRRHALRNRSGLPSPEQQPLFRCIRLAGQQVGKPATRLVLCADRHQRDHHRHADEGTRKSPEQHPEENRKQNEKR